MAGVNISVTVDGEAELERSITRFTADIKDFTPLWPEVIKEYQRIEADQFKTFGHGSWAPLSPKYAAWKSQHYPGQPLLVRTGRMRSDFTTGSAKATMTHDSVSIAASSETSYWRYHQYGTSKMPARPPVDLSEADRMSIMKKVQAWLVAQAKAAGLLSYGGSR